MIFEMCLITFFGFLALSDYYNSANREELAACKVQFQTGRENVSPACQVHLDQNAMCMNKHFDFFDSNYAGYYNDPLCRDARKQYNERFEVNDAEWHDRYNN